MEFNTEQTYNHDSITREELKSIDKARTLEAFEKIAPKIEKGEKGKYSLPAPKPGEIMICQGCGKPMYAKDFSKDKKIAEREFKWHMHDKCMKMAEEYLDRNTPGVMQDKEEEKRLIDKIKKARNKKNAIGNNI